MSSNKPSPPKEQYKQLSPFKMQFGRNDYRVQQNTGEEVAINTQFELLPAKDKFYTVGSPQNREVVSPILGSPDEQPFEFQSAVLEK